MFKSKLKICSEDILNLNNGIYKLKQLHSQEMLLEVLTIQSIIKQFEEQIVCNSCKDFKPINKNNPTYNLNCMVWKYNNCSYQ